MHPLGKHIGCIKPGTKLSGKLYRHQQWELARVPQINKACDTWAKNQHHGSQPQESIFCVYRSVSQLVFG